MRFEQVLPLMREGGKIITRSKPVKQNGVIIEQNGKTILFVKMEESRTLFKCIWSNGEQMAHWASYTIKDEDLRAENWEIAG